MPNNQFSVAEIKNLIQTKRARWKVNPLLEMADVVPRYTLGAEIPPQMPKVSEIPRTNVLQHIMKETRNPFLRARRKALRILREADNNGNNINVTNAALEPEVSVDQIVTGLSPVVDWRDRFGVRWITLPKDQDGCGSCWAFGATGVVESMVRIEHCVWSPRSEGDVHDGMGSPCANGNWPSNALDWIRDNGIADYGCYPYYHEDHAWTPTPDRNGRTVKIPGYATLTTVEDQKLWLDTVGPITICFEVFNDFFAYGGDVYHKLDDPSNQSAGWHCVLVVGYDDVNNCWICKNSWGQLWGEEWNGVRGYCRIGYGEVSCDVYAKYGLNNTNPDPWTKRRLHNGNFFESGNGATHRNFEMLATANGSQIGHYWRQGGEGGDFGWRAGAVFGDDAAVCPAFSGTTYNRNMEAIYLTTSRRLHHWYFDQASGTWLDGGVFGPMDADGVPGFIQSDYGAPGNFEVVVRTADGKLNHWWRLNGAPWTWNDGGRFGENIAFSGATLIQTRSRNLELIAVCASGQMQRYWRNDMVDFAWNAAECFGEGVFSTPCMIEGQYGATTEDTPGNYELCVAVGGQVQHWWRDATTGIWSNSATFGHDVLAVTGVVEGSFGFNLEVVVLRSDRQLQHYWRDTAGWHEGTIIGVA